jgi:hypothetical protein
MGIYGGYKNAYFYIKSIDRMVFAAELQREKDYYKVRERYDVRQDAYGDDLCRCRHTSKDKRRIMRPLLGVSYMLVIFLAGCTAVSPINSSSSRDAVQKYQLYADAAATGTARAIEFEVDLRNVQSTSYAATNAEFEAQSTQVAWATDRTVRIQQTSQSGDITFPCQSL